MEKKLSNEIRDLQNKLNNDIQNNQIDNLETIGLSNKIDKLLNDYYLVSMYGRKFPTNSNMKKYYELSYKKLVKLTVQNNKFPSLEEWNEYARENNLLSSESMKYISMLEWKYLKLKVNKQIRISKNYKNKNL